MAGFRMAIVSKAYFSKRFLIFSLLLKTR